MDTVLFQLIGGDNVFSWVIWLAFMVVFFLFYPKIMLSQIMWKLEKSARDLEILSEKSKKIVIESISKKPDKRIRDSVSSFFEFFVITPVSLDPSGIVARLDHVLKSQRDRFRYFVKQVAPKMDEEKRASIEMGLAGGMTVNEIAKIVRHYVETVRKTKSVQIAMVLQMQLPLIERLAKSMFKGTKAMSAGDPIGDSIGPLVATEIIGGKKTTEVEDGIVMAKVKMKGRDAFVLKARGPGGRIGFPGKAVKNIIEKNKIARVITIDAAAKLEGEKTGTVAEGVGVAMGGPGVERSYIEEIVTKNDIPLDSVIVKMSPEQAIEPMRKPIKDAIPKVMKGIENSIERTKKGDKIVILGVGNSSGVGDSAKDIEKLKKLVDSYEKKLKAEKKKNNN
ncbi:MAG: DUF1512 domain-containing protein [Candidatus Aenigmatarchaeota archaeon]|nr:MAG: DUF1512 domain-containing protein [Candidatus Aenigmarchaeota archaeon]